MKQLCTILIAVLAISCANEKSSTKRKVQQVGNQYVEVRYVDTLYSIGDTVNMPAIPNDHSRFAVRHNYVIIK